MGITNVPYDPRTDPGAYFARGFENMVRGIMQGQQTRRLGDFAEGMDPNATAMQILSSALSKGINPQMAMGMGSFQRGMQPRVGAQPWASTQMTSPQRQNWLDNYGRGATINVGQKLLPESDRIARAQAEQDKIMGKTGPGFGPGDRKALAENMDKRIKNVDHFHPGWKDFSEDELFAEWEKLIAQTTFDNDNQRENTWATWKEKINRLGKEVDWDPTDPKWKEAIGLGAKMKLSDVPGPATKNEFINKLRELEKVDHKLGAEYYNKYLDKFKW